MFPRVCKRSSKLPPPKMFGGACLSQIATDFSVKHNDPAPQMRGIEVPQLDFQAKKGNRNAQAAGKFV